MNFGMKGFPSRLGAPQRRTINIIKLNPTVYPYAVLQIPRGYFGFWVELYGVVPSAEDWLLFRFSYNDGASFNTNSSQHNYNILGRTAANSEESATSTTASGVRISPNIVSIPGQARAPGLSGLLIFGDLSMYAANKNACWLGVTRSSTAGLLSVLGGGSDDTAQSSAAEVKAIGFAWNTSTTRFARGRIVLSGYKD